MEPHPVPQNVTYFQFKLVGDMTLKQFLCLAAGCGIAYALLVFFASDFPIIAWPLIVISAGLGAGFAFLPIGSRPLDYWLAAFLKAIYSPTKRVWKKEGKTYKENPLFQSRLVMYTAGTNQPVSPPAEAPTLQPASQRGEPTEPLPTKEELGKTVDLARQAQQLQVRIVQTERALNQIKESAAKPSSIPVDYSQGINKIMTDLQSLVNQASLVKQKLQSVTNPKEAQTQTETIQSIPKAKVQVVIPQKPAQTTVALTSFPNVINGIVKDRTGSYLEGVVAVIYDKEGLPVRALKTNKLGQFTGSTPLHNGTYTLELEKDNFIFDVLQIELAGSILPPLQIITKEVARA
ncbi:MAG: PrgI family protein [Patescibacteria group bacterium]